MLDADRRELKASEQDQARLPAPIHGSTVTGPPGSFGLHFGHGFSDDEVTEPCEFAEWTDSECRLHPRTIEAVKERADIVDVVGEHVLKKKGQCIGICPFRRQQTVDDGVSRQAVLLLLSCGASGNSIKFLMEFQRQSFSDVVLDLAQRLAPD